jgi:hypothetical protein
VERNLTVGEVINGTLSVLAGSRNAALMYVLVFTVLGTTLEWGLYQAGVGAIPGLENAEWLLAVFGLGAGIGAIALVILTIIGQYLLWEAFLRDAGIGAIDDKRRFLAFFGQAILLGLGVGFGFLLLIVPGLIFMARWAAAPAFLIAERQGVAHAMGSSWDMVKGNTKPVVLAILIVALVFVVLAVVTVLTFSDFASEELTLPESLLGQLASHVVTALSVALGVFLFRQLHGSSRAVSGVFE